jgi:hypothetical protein
VLLGLYNNTAVMEKKCSLLSKIKHFSQKISCNSSIVNVPSEGVFSLAGHLVNKKRARLSPSNIGNIMSLLKTWNTNYYWCEQTLINSGKKSTNVK